MDKIKQLNNLRTRAKDNMEAQKRGHLQFQLAVMDYKAVCERGDKEAESEARLRTHTLLDNLLDISWQIFEINRECDKLVGE